MVQMSARALHSEGSEESRGRCLIFNSDGSSEQPFERANVCIAPAISSVFKYQDSLLQFFSIFEYGLLVSPRTMNANLLVKAYGSLWQCPGCVSEDPSVLGS